MAKRDSRILQTTAEVMAELGGPLRVSALTGAKYRNVWQWSKDDGFPARYFLVMWLELHALGFDASPRLWGQELPPEKEALLKKSVRKVAA
jgi:hypothetical protein